MASALIASSNLVPSGREFIRTMSHAKAPREDAKAKGQSDFSLRLCVFTLRLCVKTSRALALTPSSFVHTFKPLTYPNV